MQCCTYESVASLPPGASVWAGIQGSSLPLPSIGYYHGLGHLFVGGDSCAQCCARCRTNTGHLPPICRIWRVDYTEQHLPAVIVIAGGYTCPCTNLKVSTYVALFINSITLHVVELQFLIPCG